MILTFICSLLSIITFYLLKHFILVNDEENNLVTTKKEYIIIPILLIINTIVFLKLFTSTINGLLLSLIIATMFICVYTDYQNKIVYRIYSVLLIILSVLFAIINHNLYFNLNTISTICIMIAIIYVLTKSNCFGIGDALVLIGNDIILSVINPKYFIAEVLLWHFIIAAILMILFNLKEMNWKKLRFKKPIAFVPYIYISTVLISILTLFLK